MTGGDLIPIVDHLSELPPAAREQLLDALPAPLKTGSTRTRTRTRTSSIEITSIGRNASRRGGCGVLWGSVSARENPEG